MFNATSTRNGDRFLIVGRCGEDGIIGGSIAKRWKNVHVTYYTNPKQKNVFTSKSFEGDKNPNFGPTQIRKQGIVYMTLSGYLTSLTDIPVHDYEHYDYVLSVEHQDGGFGPRIVYENKHDIGYLFFVLNTMDLVNDVINIIKNNVLLIHYKLFFNTLI